MGLPKTEKFLFCITLETGGLIIGWLMALICFIMMIYCVIVMVIATVVYNAVTIQDDLVYAVFLTIIILMSLYMVFWIVVLSGSILLVIGTRKRDHTKLMPFMIFMVLGVIVAFIALFYSTVTGLVLSILLIIAEIYFFFCVYSLYDKFRNESTARNVPTPAQPYSYPQTTTIAYSQQQPQQVTYAQQQPVFVQQQPMIMPQPVYVQQQQQQTQVSEGSAPRYSQLDDTKPDTSANVSNSEPIPVKQN